MKDILKSCDSLLLYLLLLQMISESIPLSLYVHIPWCIRKCPYCDFNSYAVNKNHFVEEKYLTALLCDFKSRFEKAKNRKINSIFIGGGTPSLLSARSIEKLLNEFAKHATFNANIEITLEANPGTADKKKLGDFNSAGINRLSIGVQSFQDRYLKKLERIHSASEAKQMISSAQQAGFENINLDLMHGLPQQTVTAALADLQEALDFSGHLSWYQLTIEPETQFSNENLILPDEETLGEIQQVGKELLLKQGYENYEISAYGKQKHHCQHNINYWQFGDYLGIGAGAHSKITKEGKIIRTQTKKHPDDYLTGENFIELEETVPEKRLPLEFMMNALRLTEGVSYELFTERTGINIASINNSLQEAKERGFLIDDDGRFEGRLKTTPLGQQFLNECLEIFA